MDCFVSIIVPVYNAENVLHYCVDSILNQTYQDFELILVNDGSADNSGDICDAYAEKDARVRAIHQANGGVSKARNAGIEAAKGEYICFVDSDDYVADTYLECLLHTKESYPDTDNIWCGFQTVSNYHGTDKSIYLASEKEHVSQFNRSEIMTLHEKWLSQMPWNKLFNASAVKQNHIRFPEDLSLGEDVLFNLKYIDCTNGKIVVVNKPLNYYYRGGAESLDNKYYPDLFGIYKRINNELYRYLKKWECDEKQFTSYYNSCFFSYEKALRNTFHEKSITNHRIKFNRKIMCSEVFREAFTHTNCFIHPIYRFVYSFKLSFIYALLYYMI